MIDITHKSTTLRIATAQAIVKTSDIATVPGLLKQIPNEVGNILGDGVYYRKRMEKYMSRHKHLENSKFIGPPKNTDQSNNRIKVEEGFSRYKRIIGNKI